MKKGIALFLTLLFISLIIIIIGEFFKIYEKVSTNTFYKEISQNSILIKDITNILKKISKDINGSEIKKIFNTFPISSKDGNFRALIKITPITNKVNINKIDNQYLQKYLDNILEYYQISDPIFFRDLILDTLDLDKKERSGGSEIILQNPFFKQGKIYNFNHLKKIIDYYYNLTNDNKIYNIPWKKLFSFENNIIDCNLISKTIANFLELKYKEPINCKNIINENNQTLLSNLNIKSFQKDENYSIKINILYNEENLSLIYNLGKNRIEKVLYFPIY